jgi:hypothetical protein
MTTTNALGAGWVANVATLIIAFATLLGSLVAAYVALSNRKRLDSVESKVIDQNDLTKRNRQLAVTMSDAGVPLPEPTDQS